METIFLSIAIMIGVAAALSLKVLVGREREVKRFGCGSFNAIDPGSSGRSGRRSTTACGVCGAQEGEVCKDDEASVSADPTDHHDFSRN